MTDPMDALNGLQSALDAKSVQLQSCEVHRNLRVFLDHPMGTPRFTYALIEGGKVNAVALFVLIDPVEGVPCWQIGYAVVAQMRGKGLGTRILSNAIEELQNGLKRTPMKEFYLEAVVSPNNEASNKIARRVLSATPVPGTDQFVDEPALQYLRKVIL